ncbi:MAG TPA: 3-dehydroquinate synthase [Geminicoccus sp.]|jgi:3-dehydroquinate synthase|uniref:3-dehydroquinate synthase n=1 Tax=Geminicoccus sp. TaxID=2024832 RepID=UPI002E380308|nr:3-dehydroquinate synthase [Geminicoccus sp.]HEX2527769.1 3-dehydroquinate synthase [Geminicoccus sp.]
MTSIRTVHVPLGARAYEVKIGAGLLDRAGQELAPLLPSRRVVVVADDAMRANSHLDRLERALDEADLAVRTVTVPSGEGSKGWPTLERVCEQVLGQGIDRKTAIVALGGGVIGDLAGFAASILLRGLPFVQVPTTLLAQVDSSVGGKTGINARSGKNLVGAFHQPRIVLIDPTTLDTLPLRELQAGYAEVAKYGLIHDAAFFDWLEQNGRRLIDGDQDVRTHAIERSCAIKAEIVGDDEFETKGGRALLNFGHTFAHAYENLSGYGSRLLHGEAVAIGMVQATELSTRAGHLAEGATERVRSHLRSLGLKTSPAEVTNEGFEPDAMLAAMARDKKVADGRLTFVLLKRIGAAVTSGAVPPDILRQLLAQPV